MPTNRFNYSDDFVLNNGKVGINSASPQEKLDVFGVTKAENLNVVGVSSLTGYEGFLRANHNVAESTSLEGGQGTTGSLSGEIVIGTGVTVTGVTTATSGQGYIDTLKVYNTFTVPVGLTTDRPTAPKPGQLYYNKDFASIEFYDGDRWRQVDNTTQRGRGINWTYSSTPSSFSTRLEYITISSTGNAIYFGDLTTTREPGQNACASSIRGIFGGGENPGGNSNVIDYVTIASQGNAQDFGDLTVARGAGPASCSSSTRGLFAGGRTPTSQNVIDYIQISTIGNALDFGDLNTTINWLGSCASPTRGFFVGGGPSDPFLSDIRFVTISSTGNSVKFGDLTSTRQVISGISNSIRGIFAGGQRPNGAGSNGSNDSNDIEYIIMSSTGNAVDFGDLTLARRSSSGTSNSTRGVFSAGVSSAPVSPITNVNIIDYITITSTGNAIDFGDSGGIGFGAGCSDSHGGLGGF